MAALTTEPCTAESCPVPGGFAAAPPHLVGNAVLLSAFAALIPINLFFGVRYRMPLYAAFFIAGLGLEVMAHIGRIMMRDDLASRQYFLMAMVGTVTAPTFLCAAVFVVLPHVLAVYGERVCVIPSPLWVGMFFFGFDVFALAFQIVGCVFTVNGISRPEMNQGVNVLLAGMGVLVASIVAFFGVYYWFVLRISRHPDLLDSRFANIYLSSRFKIFLLCIQIAAAFLLARTISRIIQLCAGLSSVIFQSQVLSMVLDSTVVLLACIVLTLAPPGVAFGDRAWRQTSPHLLGRWSASSSPSSRARDHDGPYSLQGHGGPYPYPYRGGGHDRHHPHYFYHHQRQQSDPRVPKPYAHQVPGHWQYPNLYKAAPRPAPVKVTKYDPEGEHLQDGDNRRTPGSAGSQNQHKPGDSRRNSKRLSPRQTDMVDEEALW